MVIGSTPSLEQTKRTQTGGIRKIEEHVQTESGINRFTYLGRHVRANNPFVGMTHNR